MANYKHHKLDEARWDDLTMTFKAWSVCHMLIVNNRTYISDRWNLVTCKACLRKKPQEVSPPLPAP